MRRPGLCLGETEGQSCSLQLNGSPLPATNGSLLPALKRGQLHVGSVTQIGDLDASPKRGRLHMGTVTHAEAWTVPHATKWAVPTLHAR